MNGHYIGQTDPGRLLDWIMLNTPPGIYISHHPREYLYGIIRLLQGRLKTLADFFPEASYFFAAPETYEEKGVSKYFAPDNTREILEHVLDLMQGIEVFEASGLETAFRGEASKMNLKAAQLIHPTRLALSGRTSTPGLFEVMELLGRKTCIDRVKRAILYIS